MFTLIKLLKKILKIFTSNAQPWQIALGTALGTLLGFLPLWHSGPNPLACIILLLIVLINCHLGSALLFWGLGALIALASSDLALALGNGLDGVAQKLAEFPLTYASLLSETRHLGWAVLGLLCAPVAATGMALLTGWFRGRIIPKLEERRRLKTAGKLAGNSIVLTIAAWFFDI